MAQVSELRKAAQTRGQELIKQHQELMVKAKQIEDARKQINEAIRQNALKKQRQANVEDIDAFEIEVFN